jgi:hypothetical protein
MWPISLTAQQVLAGSHQITVRATAFTDRHGTITDLPISSGAVMVDATSQVRRTARLTVADPGLWPVDPFDVLSPLGSELLIEYGIVVPGAGVEWVPLIRGVITDISRDQPVTSGQGALPMSLADRSIKVADDRFDQPVQTIPGARVVSEIQRLIRESLPDVTVTDHTGSTQLAAVIEIERERWADGIEKLSDALGAETFADPTGDFVIRPQATHADPVVWQIHAGHNGILVSTSEKQTREQVYNRVIASGQRSDATPAVWAAVSDTNPNSPTRYGGPMGRKPRFYSSPLLTTTQQCHEAASALLARTTGMHASLSLTAITNPALDAGDVISVDTGTGSQVHVIDTVTIPLAPGDAQEITTRTLDLPPETA